MLYLAMFGRLLVRLNVEVMSVRLLVRYLDIEVMSVSEVMSGR